MSQGRLTSVPVDLIRTLAIVGVVLLHATNDLTLQQMNSFEIVRWSVVDVYQSVGRMGVPLFIMVTGALLLAPCKQGEELGVFFKKRFVRIGLPFLFWAVIYFVWQIAVLGKPLTQAFIVQGILTGPYLQFWYIYMLIGLYLLTPFFRVIVAHANEKLFRYFVVLWLVGTSAVPFVGLLSNGGYHLDTQVFTIPTFVGYFILGIYLLTVQVRRRTLFGLMGVGLFLTAIGTVVVSGSIGGGTSFFFQEYVSPTMILASVAFFLLLNTVKSPCFIPSPTGQMSLRQVWTRKILKVISDNTLGIFFMHLIVLYTLQNGIFGFTLNGNTVNSIIGVPLATALTLGICLVVLVPLKKVPVLRNFLG